MIGAWECSAIYIYMIYNIYIYIISISKKSTLLIHSRLITTWAARKKPEKSLKKPGPPTCPPRALAFHQLVLHQRHCIRTPQMGRKDLIVMVGSTKTSFDSGKSIGKSWRFQWFRGNPTSETRQIGDFQDFPGWWAFWGYTTSHCLSQVASILFLNGKSQSLLAPKSHKIP